MTHAQSPREFCSTGNGSPASPSGAKALKPGCDVDGDLILAAGIDRVAASAAGERRRARARLLQGKGVAVHHDLPGVGGNLQDHLQLRLIYPCGKNTVTLNQRANSVDRQARAWEWSMCFAETRPAHHGAQPTRASLRKSDPSQGNRQPRISRSAAVPGPVRRTVAPVPGLHGIGLRYSAGKVAGRCTLRSPDPQARRRPLRPTTCRHRAISRRPSTPSA